MLNFKNRGSIKSVIGATAFLTVSSLTAQAGCTPEKLPDGKQPLYSTCIAGRDFDDVLRRWPHRFKTQLCPEPDGRFKAACSKTPTVFSSSAYVTIVNGRSNKFVIGGLDQLEKTYKSKDGGKCFTQEQFLGYAPIHESGHIRHLVELAGKSVRAQRKNMAKTIKAVNDLRPLWKESEVVADYYYALLLSSVEKTVKPFDRAICFRNENKDNGYGNKHHATGRDMEKLREMVKKNLISIPDFPDGKEKALSDWAWETAYTFYLNEILTPEQRLFRAQHFAKQGLPHHLEELKTQEVDLAKAD